MSRVTIENFLSQIHFLLVTAFDHSLFWNYQFFFYNGLFGSKF
jgi:hypothetical protein